MSLYYFCIKSRICLQCEYDYLIYTDLLLGSRVVRCDRAVLLDCGRSTHCFWSTSLESSSTSCMRTTTLTTITRSGWNLSIAINYTLYQNICKRTSFWACDSLLFLFTIITLRSLVLSYDEVMMKLWRICDDFMTNLWFFENRAPGRLVSGILT